LNAQADLSRLVRELRDMNRWENGRARPSPLAMEKIEALLSSMGERGSDLLIEIFGGKSF